MPLGVQVTSVSEFGLGCSWSKGMEILKPGMLCFIGSCTIVETALRRSVTVGVVLFFIISAKI